MYGGWHRISHPSSATFLRVPKVACGLKLSWSSMMSFLLNIVGLLVWSTVIDLSNCLRFFQLIKTYWSSNVPHIHNILLFRFNFGSEVEEAGFPSSQDALFLYDIFIGNLFIPSYTSSRNFRFCCVQAEVCIWWIDHLNSSQPTCLTHISNNFPQTLVSEYDW